VSREPKTPAGRLKRARGRHLAKAAMAANLAALRRGEDVTVFGKVVSPIPKGRWDMFDGGGYVVEALFLYRGKVRLREVSFKDAWPNPTLFGGRVDGTRHIPFGNLYGWVDPDKNGGESK